MEPIKIQQSAVKAYLLLAGSFLFTAVGVYDLHVSEGHRFILGAGVVFFGLGIPVFGTLIVRPQRLLLDSRGFQLLGGLRRRPTNVSWAEVDQFFLYNAGRAGIQIGYNYKPEVNRFRRMRSINRAFGAEGMIPATWDIHPEILVQLLNEYRVRAAAQAAELEEAARVTSAKSP